VPETRAVRQFEWLKVQHQPTAVSPPQNHLSTSDATDKAHTELIIYVSGAHGIFQVYIHAGETANYDNKNFCVIRHAQATNVKKHNPDFSAIKMFSRYGTKLYAINSEVPTEIKT